MIALASSVDRQLSFAITLRPSLGSTRGRSTILKLWKHPRMTLLGPPVPENDPPDLPESDLDIPDDPILDFVNSQCHSSEDLDQALQAYQAYQVPCPQDSTMTPERSINHHFTYHIAQASQAKHGSLVDRGANGGLAGSDVRILSRSSRKCTVTGIDSHELQGLDVVQCAALVETNHGIVNLIMNEYACYGKGHTIHSLWTD